MYAYAKKPPIWICAIALTTVTAILLLAVPVQTLETLRNSPGQALFAAAFAAAILIVLVRENRMRVESRRTEGELERFRAVLDQAGDAIFVMDPDTGKIIDCNLTASRLLGYDRSALLEMTLSDFEADSPSASPESWEQHLSQLRDADEPLLSQRMYRTKQGDQVPVEVSVSCKTWANRAYLLSVARDISERLASENSRRQLEAQLRHAQKLETIGTLASGIAHNFNNVLSAIDGFTNLVIDDLPPGSQNHERLQEVLNAAELARDVVQQILMLSRKTDGERVPMLIGGIAQEALKLVRATLPNSIVLHEQIEAESDFVLADATAIHQIIMNLCTNAAHAMQATGGPLTVRLRVAPVDPALAAGQKELDAAAALCLQVDDRGHGMDTSTLERIFDPYFTTKNVGEGTGLGLAIVDGLVRNHGGMIAVDSEPGAGTRFTVYLPLYTGPLPEAAPLPGPAAEDTTELDIRVVDAISPGVRASD